MYSRKKAQGVLFFGLVEEYGERRGGRHVKGLRIREEAGRAAYKGAGSLGRRAVGAPQK